MPSTSARQQADVVLLMGLNQKATAEALRGNSKQPGWKADAIEDRLPALRDAFSTLDKIAKEAGQ